MLGKYTQLVSAIIVTIAYAILNYAFHLELAAHILVYCFVGIISLLVVIDMVKTLRSGHFGIDILALSAIIAALIAGEFLASLLIIIMLTGGESLENYASRRAKRELTKLVQKAPTIAHVINDDDTTEDVPIHKIKLGDHILIKTGEMIPIDGTLLVSSATLDTSSLTGESLPRSYKKGDQILSGSINQEESISITATSTYKDSQYSQIIKMVEDIESKPSHFVRMADRYAIPFTILAYAIAGLAWAISGEFIRFVEVLVVASPCPLILAAPVAFISGMSRASAGGVIVKAGPTLEKLASIKSIAFDKTGTLSKGQIVVKSVKSLDKKYSDAEILKMIASAEQASSHILARSIVDYAKSKKLELEKPPTVKEHTGMGLDLTKDNHKIIIGNINHMLEHKISLSGIENRASSSIFIAIDSKIVGQITFQDNIRREAKSVISHLHKLGITEIAMVTGDTKTNAAEVADSVGITEYHAECLPLDKVRIVSRELSKPVAFVGDGINDAPVLAAADVSMALAAYGSTAASDAASVVIMADDLRKVPFAYEVAKRTVSIAKQSVIGGIALAIILMVVASFGFIPVILGAVLQEIMDVLSILNALRALKK